MPATYIIGSETLPMSQIKVTKRAANTTNLEPNGQKVVVDTDKEVIINSITVSYVHDDIQKDSFVMSIGGQDYISLTAPEPNRSTIFLTPSTLFYDGNFEVLSNEKGNRYVVLKRPIRVKGLKITLRNRDPEYNLPLGFNMIYSEVE